MGILFLNSKICQEIENYKVQYPNMEIIGDPMHQSDMSINVDEIDEDLHRLLDDSPGVTLPHNVIIPIPVTPLTKSQKRSAKKKAQSSEYTPSKPSCSRTVTFNKSLLSPPFTPFKQLKQDFKPQSTPINNGKKLKQNETDNTLKNGNVIITIYIPQDQKQAHLLDLVVYDIPAKWDNYTLLANLG
ncbi:hypothetical protein RclHR1_26130001 [Rhizophagus clarus]|uniref:Uncharacterized protein n=1 Tax=Rhizophagus clarus TaxID=94130 RepID=A0A2Z6R038_9GLOM|nr:hypothetical protein RclHR1_26130001 [Rhizophagus clarus]